MTGPFFVVAHFVEVMLCKASNSRACVFSTYPHLTTQLAAPLIWLRDWKPYFSTHLTLPLPRGRARGGRHGGKCYSEVAQTGGCMKFPLG